MKEKNKMQYLKIKTKDVKRYIGYYENWYNTFDKDGYKYVIEQLSCDHNINDKYYNNVLSSLHNFIKGGEFYPIKKIHDWNIFKCTNRATKPCFIWYNWNNMVYS